MIAKMSIICPLLLLVGFITFSNSSPTDKPVSKSVLELHDEALQACSINSTRDLIKALKNIKEEIVEDVCSVSCYAQSLGIVNDRGLNKIAFNWTLDVNEYGYRGVLYYDDNPSTLREIIQRKMDDIQNSTYHVVHLFNDACSTKNQTAIDLIFAKNVSHLAVEELDNLMPSEEDSPMLELIENAANTCSMKFNVSWVEIADNIQGHIFYSRPSPHKKTVCYAHCMLSELDIASETGLNEPWAGTMRDVFNYGSLKMLNEAVTLSHSKCLTDFNELADDYFDGLFVKPIESYM